MRRRDLLATGIAAIGVFKAGLVLGQPAGAGSRAAVVIGVDKAGSLPPLNAVAGAREVADWLQTENFEVKLIVDDVKPVRPAEIFDAVAAFVDRGTLTQLVIYFAGHGFLTAYAEHWMLSDAPRDPNAAISLKESVDLARNSGIPNVVFISDACRSTSESLGTQLVRGALIFPTPGFRRNIRSDVDVFLATLAGDPALELPIGDEVRSFQGIYTAAFLSAYRKPDDEMVRTVNGVPVVPNNRMKKFLEREVRRLAQAQSLTLRQIPDTNVVSDETVYIGRVAGAAVAAPALRPPADLGATVRDLAWHEIARSGSGSVGGYRALSDAAARRVSEETGAARVQDRILQGQQSVPSGMETGLVVSGTQLNGVVTGPAVRANLVQPGDGRERPHVVSLTLGDANAGAVALQFGDQAGTVLAALRGYVATVIVESGRVSSVSYSPAPRGGRAHGSERDRERLERLHAAVATSARFGVFRIEGDKASRTGKARELADQIRVLKGVDPTLGLYAAYAYDEADLPEQVSSVASIMRGDLGADIFDVALLSGSLSGRERTGGDMPVPFCPMLSQGWSLLRVRSVSLPPAVSAARDHLRSALWTTFEPDGMAIVIRHLEERVTP